jgi:hypothetical protein
MLAGSRLVSAATVGAAGCPVLTLDTHGSVDTEASRALPGEHAAGIDLANKLWVNGLKRQHSLRPAAD